VNNLVSLEVPNMREKCRTTKTQGAFDQTKAGVIAACLTTALISIYETGKTTDPLLSALRMQIEEECKIFSNTVKKEHLRAVTTYIAKATTMARILRKDLTHIQRLELGLQSHDHVMGPFNPPPHNTNQDLPAGNSLQPSTN
jgi:hypothetical protein